MKQKPVAGIDVSKAFSDMCILSPENEIVLETKIYHDFISMERAVQALLNIQKQFEESPVIIMESTAHYHRVLHQYLIDAGFQVIVINPIQSGGIKNLNIRKIKNDKVDAKRLAMLYRLNYFKESSISNGVLDSLKDLTRQRADLVAERVKFTNKIIGFLDQAFPGYKKVFSEIKVKSSIAILMKFPTPDLILSARKDAIRKVIAEASGRTKKSTFAAKKADILIQVAIEAKKICLSRSSYEPLIKMTANVVSVLQRSIDELEQNIRDLAMSDDICCNSVELLSSIPGIGTFAAIVILSEIGDYSRFSKSKQLTAFCGLDPSVKQSGNYLGTRTKISKRGSPYLRKILDVCTHVAVHPCTKHQPANRIMEEYYLKKRETKPEKVAICACMHKMITIIFAVLRDQKPFEFRTPAEHISIMREHRNNPAA